MHENNLKYIQIFNSCYYTIENKRKNKNNI